MRTLTLSMIAIAVPAILAAQGKPTVAPQVNNHSVTAARPKVITAAAATTAAQKACAAMNPSPNNRGCTQMQGATLAGTATAPIYTFRYIYCSSATCTSSTSNGVTTTSGKHVHALMILSASSGVVLNAHATQNGTTSGGVTANDSWLASNMGN